MVEKIKATLFISSERREKIRRTGMSLEEYCEMTMKREERFCMDKWTDSSFWMGVARVCFLKAETLNFILDQFNDDELFTIGRQLGKKARNHAEHLHNINPDDDASRKEVLERLNDYGWGHLTWKKDVIFIITPVFKQAYFIRGYLEGLLNIGIMIIEDLQDRITLKCVSIESERTRARRLRFMQFTL